MVKIDKEACIGCGSCVAACPEVFEIVGSKAIVKAQKNTPCVQDAIDSCPTDAISK